MVSHSDFQWLLYLCEKHEGFLSEKAHRVHPSEPIYVKIMVPSCVVGELYRLKMKKKRSYRTLHKNAQSHSWHVFTRPEPRVTHGTILRQQHLRVTHGTNLRDPQTA